MPRRAKPPRLYLDLKRREWVIRDRENFIRTGCAEGQIREAEGRLHEYLGSKHKPQPSGSPLIADVLLLYHDERVIHTKSTRSNLHAIKNLSQWWGDKHVSDITPDTCRTYIAGKGRSVHAARHDLEALRAALNYWHRSKYGPLDRIPAIIMPPKAEPRERWLTENEFNRLLKAAGPEHLKRFLLLGWHTGTRPGAILDLEWSWIDLRAGVMRRRAPGRTEDAKKKRPPVRLGKIILEHLRRWHREDGQGARYVVHLDGRKLDGVRYSWENAVAEAGLDESVTPHTLRHSCVTRKLQAGASIWDVAGFVGMTPETVSRVYGHHSADFQKMVADL